MPSCNRRMPALGRPATHDARRFHGREPNSRINSSRSAETSGTCWARVVATYRRRNSSSSRTRRPFSILKRKSFVTAERGPAANADKPFRGTGRPSGWAAGFNCCSAAIGVILSGCGFRALFPRAVPTGPLMQAGRVRCPLRSITRARLQPSMSWLAGRSASSRWSRYRRASLSRRMYGTF